MAALNRVNLEFEFVDDPSGGSFVVSAGNLTNVLLASCAANDIEGACRLYEDHGAAVADEMMSLLATASSTTRECAAKMLVAARDFERAAKVYEISRRWKDAAPLHEQAGDFKSAARCYQQAGELAQAAAAYDRAGQLDPAVVFYEKAGARQAAADCLVRNGRPFEAAQIYRQLGNLRGEYEALRAVSVDAPEQPGAVRRVAQMLSERGRAAEAVQILIESMRQCPAARSDAATLQQLAALLDASGAAEQAKRVRERIAGLGSASPAPVAAAPVAVAPDDAYARLKALPIFSELSLEDMRDLYRLAEEADFAPGTQIIAEGEEARGLYVLLAGEAEVSAKGRSLNAIGPGACLGEISLLEKGRTSARVVAKTAVRSLFIGRSRFERYLYSHEAAALRIYRLFACRLAERVRALSS